MQMRLYVFTMVIVFCISGHVLYLLNTRVCNKIYLNLFCIFFVLQSDAWMINNNCFVEDVSHVIALQDAFCRLFWRNFLLRVIWH